MSLPPPVRGCRVYMNTCFHVLSWCAKVLIFMTGQEDIEVLGFRAFVQSTQWSMAQNAFFHTFMNVWVWGVHIDFLWAEQWEKWIKIRTRTFPEPQFPKLLHVLCFQLLCDEWCQATCVLLADRIAQVRFVQSYVYFDGVWAALHGTSKMGIYFLPQQAHWFHSASFFLMIF